MEVLAEALSIYHYLVSHPEIEDDIFEMACNRYMEVVPKLEGDDENEIWFSSILQKLVDRFPHKVKYKRQLGLEYVQKNENITEVIKLFEDILDKNDTLGTLHKLLISTKGSSV